MFSEILENSDTFSVGFLLHDASVSEINQIYENYEEIIPKKDGIDHIALSSVLDSDSERHKYDDDAIISSLRFSGEVVSEGSGRCGSEDKKLQHLP